MFEQPITKKSVKADGKDEAAEIQSLSDEFDIKFWQFFGLSNSSVGQVSYLFSAFHSSSNTTPRLLTFTDNQGYGALPLSEKRKYKKAPIFLMGVFFHVTRVEGFNNLPFGSMHSYTELKKDLRKPNASFLEEAIIPIKPSQHRMLEPVAGYFITPKLLMAQSGEFIQNVLRPDPV